jgi:hypothetical protein
MPPPSLSKQKLLYEFAKAGICSFADIRLEDDGATGPCDALSFGTKFTTVSARISPHVDSTGVGPGICAPGASLDKCDTVR